MKDTKDIKTNPSSSGFSRSSRYFKFFDKISSHFVCLTRSVVCLGFLSSPHVSICWWRGLYRTECFSIADVTAIRGSIFHAGKSTDSSSEVNNNSLSFRKKKKSSLLPFSFFIIKISTIFANSTNCRMVLGSSCLPGRLLVRTTLLG